MGDRVAYIDGGSYAEYTSVGTLSAGKIPDKLSYSDATAALLQGLTAWTMVRDAYAVKKGGKIIYMQPYRRSDVITHTVTN